MANLPDAAIVRSLTGVRLATLVSTLVWHVPTSNDSHEPKHPRVSTADRRHTASNDDTRHCTRQTTLSPLLWLREIPTVGLVEAFGSCGRSPATPVCR